MFLDPITMYDVAKEKHAEVLREAEMAHYLAEGHANGMTVPKRSRRVKWQSIRRLSRPRFLGF